jgi:hypothetical protein
LQPNQNPNGSEAENTGALPCRTAFAAQAASETGCCLDDLNLYSDIYGFDKTKHVWRPKNTFSMFVQKQKTGFPKSSQIINKSLLNHYW